MSLPDEFKRFPKHWDVLPFTDVVSDATSGNLKTQKGDYLEEGEIPVVDQGQALFGGYTDNSDAVCKAALPTIIFGDHTRLFKFVEQPFALGADGAKVLEPVEKLDKKFLFHYLNQLRITSAGYSRHYKFLKETYVPVPPLPEQKRIAAILDKADAIRRKRQQAIQLADEFLRSVFLDMFGDPLINPKGFKPRLLKEFYIDEKTGTKCGPFGSALKKEEYVESGIPVWNMDNISLSGEFIDKPNLWITEVKYEELESYSIKAGDVIISRAGTVGKMGVVRSEHSKSIISTNLIRVRFGSDLLPEYFVCLMTYCKTRLGRLKTGPDGAFTHMNTGILDDLEFPYPPASLQRDYLLMRNQVLKILKKNGRWEEMSNNSFSAISQRAFSGQL